MKRSRPTWDELNAWVRKLSLNLSDEERQSIQDVLKHAQSFGMSWEVVWWAYVRRNDDDFNLRVCLNEGLQEWDL